jgi:ABC-type uncharacterized transport system substrate-binding protein
VRRRAFIAIGVGAVVWPLTADAQQSERMRRIGLLSSVSKDGMDFELAALRQGLSEAGFIEGRNLVIEYRFADGDYARLPALASDLLSSDVEVIVTSGGPQPAAAASKATAKIPIVATSASSFVKQFNRPEGNLTGVNITTGTLQPKRLQILAEMKPGAAIGVLMNPAYSRYEQEREEVENAARSLHVNLQFAAASADADFDPAFAELVSHHIGSLLIGAEPFFDNHRQRLVALAAQYAIPTMHEWRESVIAGGLMSYGPNITEIDRQVGHYAGEVLNGAKPADLPVVAPAKFELVINLRTARTLGLEMPPSLLAQADEVIE